MPHPALRTALLLALLPASALAHAGPGVHGSPFAAGLAHPVLGPDHLLAMVAVGLFAALAGMILGGALGTGGGALPVVEPTILASVVILGAMAAAALRPPLALACAAIAVFGVAHGHAHGVEGPALGGLAYAAGFLIATAALHAIGLLVGLAAGGAGRPAITRGLGGATALTGLALAVA